VSLRGQVCTHAYAYSRDITTREVSAVTYTKILGKRNVNSLIRKIFYYKIPIGIKIVGVPKKPLSITY
jgi:hypothetical protein